MNIVNLQPPWPKDCNFSGCNSGGYVSDAEAFDPSASRTSPGGPLLFHPSGKPVLIRIHPVKTDDQSQPHHEPFENVPVRVWLSGPAGSSDGLATQQENAGEDFHLVQETDVEFCSGVMTQAAGGVISASCDQLHQGEANLTASTDDLDENGVGILGTVIGITKAPAEPGWYTVMVETDDARFNAPGQRKWRVGWKFDVVGGRFLDENWEPILSFEIIQTLRRFVLEVDGNDIGPERELEVQETKDGAVIQTLSLTGERVGGSKGRAGLVKYQAPFNLTSPGLPGEENIDPTLPLLKLSEGVLELDGISLAADGKNQLSKSRSGSSPVATIRMGTPSEYSIEIGTVKRFGLRRDCSVAPAWAGSCVYLVVPSPCPVNTHCSATDIPPGGDLIDPDTLTWRLSPRPDATAANRAFHLHEFQDGGTAVEGTVFAERVTNDATRPWATGLPQVLDVTGTTDVIIPALLRGLPREYIRDNTTCTAPNDCWHTATNTFGGATTIQVDEEINKMASFMAFPPDVMKAQVFQESYGSSRFDPNVVRYEPLTIDFRYLTGEFTPHPRFSDSTELPVLLTFTLPGGRVVDANKPPDTHPPVSSRSIKATASGTSLVLPSCSDCRVKVFFGNPGGTQGNPSTGDPDSYDGPNPVNEGLTTGIDLQNEMEFEVQFNGLEVPTYLAQDWQNCPSSTVSHSLPTPVPDGSAVLNPSTGEVTYHGAVAVGDELSLLYDPVSSLITTGVYPLGNLVEPTDILSLIANAKSSIPWVYPPGYGHDFGDLISSWYPGFTDPRKKLNANTSERLWRLDLDGRPLDPKFDVEAQFIWGQTMGATQFQILQLFTETWGNPLRVIHDESGTIVFDLFDADKSLPVLLRYFSVDLQFLKATYDAKGAFSAYPCTAGAGLTCSDIGWQTWVANALRVYNGAKINTTSGYPEDVYDHLTSSNSSVGAFGGNVEYKDPIP